jgi:hypothetical protein
MKFSNGSYKPWAEDVGVREALEDMVLDTYYVFYVLVALFAFLLLPLVFFFHLVSSDEEGLEDDIGVTAEVEPFRSKMCRAIKYTGILIAVFTALVVAGYFIPAGDDLPPHNGTTLQEWRSALEYEFEEFKRERGENILVFLLNVLNMVGMFFFVIYTGYGMSSLPVGMIKGQRSVFTERSAVDREIENVETQVKTIEERNADASAVPSYETAQLDRLQQQLRLLRRTRHDLNMTGRSFVNRLCLVCRPFQFVIGVFFSVVGLLIFVSLLLTSVDKGRD